jgi:hypothetical protein
MPACRRVIRMLCYLSLLAGSFAAAAQPMELRASRSFPAGNSPIWVESGDFDEDGAPDLVVASGTSSVLALLRGDGTGRFEAPRSLLLLQIPRSVIAADLNRDGHLDLAVGNTDSGSFVSILLGDGLGGFGSERRFPAGGVAEFIAVADITGDGHVDLVVNNRDDSRVALLAGDGLGGFAMPVAFATAATPQEIAVADLDRDGRLDVVVACAGAGSVSALINLGAGILAPPVNTPLLVSIPRTLALADLDGDGLVDLVAGDRDMEFRLGDGHGGFPSLFFRRRVPNGTSAVLRAIDIDGNGHPDIAAALGSASLTPNVFLVLGSGTSKPLATASAEAGDGSAHLTIADFDGDGDLDIVTANTASHDVSFLAGDGGGNLRNHRRLFLLANPIDAAVADFNLDGNPDLAVVNVPASSTESDCTDPPRMFVAILLGDGMGGSIGSTTHAVGCLPQAVVTADFNRDGFPDIATANAGIPGTSFLPSLTILLGDGQGSVMTSRTLPNPDEVATLATGDFDADGSPDLAVGAIVTGSIVLHRGDGTGEFPESRTIAVPAGPRSLQSVDLNEDGHADLVMVFPAQSRVGVLLGDGTFGGFLSSSSLPVGPAPQRLALADLNEDGHLDIATADTGFGEPPGQTVSLLLSTAPGIFLSAASIQTDPTPLALAAVDLDLDGHLDLAVVVDGRSVVIHFGDGTGAFGPAQRFGAGVEPIGIAPVDFNQDGLPDLAVLDRPMRAVSLLINLLPKASRLVLSAEGGALSWIGLEGALAYDVVRGDVRALLEGRGDFAASVLECLADDTVTTEVSSPQLPSIGEVDWYLLRPILATGPGSYDSGGPAQVGSRDPGINASRLACP